MSLKGTPGMIGDGPGEIVGEKQLLTWRAGTAILRVQGFPGSAASGTSELFELELV